MKLLQRIARGVRLARRTGGRVRRLKDLSAPFPLELGGRFKWIQAGDDAAAKTTFREIVADDFYKLNFLASRAPPQTIVDIGANIGIFSAAADLLFPAAGLWAYEPNPACEQFLRANAPSGAHIGSVAVGARKGLARFKVEPHTSTGRLSSEGDVDVAVIDSAQVADGRWIDLLKMDCEGGEWEILADGSLLKRSNCVVIEYHVEGDRTPELLRHWLEQAGHTIHFHLGITPYSGHFVSAKE